MIRIDKKPSPVTAKEVRKMREVTGLGMMECKELLQVFGGDFDKLTKHTRANSDEPFYDGLTESRFDILNKAGEVVFTCSNLEEAHLAGYNLTSNNLRIRGVDCFGRYSDVHVK